MAREVSTPEQLARRVRLAFRDVEDACEAFGKERTAMQSEIEGDAVAFQRIKDLCSDGLALGDADSLYRILERIDLIADAALMGEDVENLTLEAVDAC